MLCLGIDPGQSAGIVAVDVSPLGPIRWRSGITVNKPQRRVQEATTDHELRFIVKLTTGLAEYRDAKLVVLERPGDAAGWWAGQGQRGHKRGTLFTSGTHYLSALVAANEACPQARLVSYAVEGRAGEPGWMPKEKTRGLTHTVKRETLLRALQTQASEIGAPADLSKHWLMAFGVLQYHLALRGIRAA